AGGDSPLRQVTIADDLAVAVGVAAALVAGDPVGDLGGDGLGEEFLGALAEDVGKDVLGLGEGHEADIGGRKAHGGVLLCRVGTFGEPQYTKSTPPFFIPLSTTFDHTPFAFRQGSRRHESTNPETRAMRQTSSTPRRLPIELQQQLDISLTRGTPWEVAEF